MKHHVTKRKFGREKGTREALVRSLLRSLILKEKIETTEAKAKEIRPLAEKLVTKGKSGTVHARRVIESQLGDSKSAEKVLNNLSKRFAERQGGYTRIIKKEPRKSDGSPMAIIEFV